MTFDLYGRKLNLTKGKKIEFVDVMKELDKELDLYHYYEKTIISFYTRFIMYDKKYEPTSISIIMQIKNSDEKYMQIDNYAQKQAKSQLESFVKENIIINSLTFKMRVFYKKAYKCVYKRAIKKMQKILYQKIGYLYEIFYDEWFSYKIFMTSNPVKIL